MTSMPRSRAVPRSSWPVKSGRTIIALMLREMSTTYGRSALGYLWAILEPVGGIMLMTFIFSLAFRAPPMGDSFPLFYASGMLPYLMYMEMSGKIAGAIRFSKPLLFYPGVTFMDALIARFLLTALTQLAVFVIVLTSIIVWFDLTAILNYSAIATGLGMALMLGLGVGTLNCYLFAMSPMWERSWGILNRPLFIISCIFFLFDTVPQPFRDYLWFNPLIHAIGAVRQGIYATYSGDYVSILYVFGISFTCLVLGLIFLRHSYRDIVNM
ncbi:ABC transporter permease [Aestuariibius insulae]|uniref:ABC transporter permease n=1 Tax=Aestuariibius insulae TaxID=2058287 RepID=UPI00398E5256